jgi:glutathione S-transferase
VNPLPILYSFRRCPYAIRARLAIKVSQLQVELREVVLADKPKEMLRLSPKATVPVLVLADGTVIDESRDIMLWALEQYDPQHWLGADSAQEKEISHLIDLNDTEFKSQLDRYKYADRYPQQSMVSYRQQAEVFLQHLEDKLNQHPYLIGEAATLADMALLPFIRQFAYVDADWFAKTHYTKLQIWLANFLAEKLFSDVMKKFPQWRSSDSVQTIF